MTTQQALQKLKDGNTRFVGGKLEHPGTGGARRKEVLNGQKPFAAILTCSDSRVPPEIIFDCGIGDIFVIRVAGNVLDDTVRGSLAYAALHLKCPMIVVLGHSLCGAVTASIQPDEALAGEPDSIASIIDKVRSNIPATMGKKYPAIIPTRQSQKTPWQSSPRLRPMTLSTPL